MVPGFHGLIVIGPWLSHATWHAYRDVVISPVIERKEKN